MHGVPRDVWGGKSSRKTIVRFLYLFYCKQLALYQASIMSTLFFHFALSLPFFRLPFLPSLPPSLNINPEFYPQSYAPFQHQRVVISR